MEVTLRDIYTVVLPVVELSTSLVTSRTYTQVRFSSAAYTVNVNTLTPLYCAVARAYEVNSPMLW